MARNKNYAVGRYAEYRTCEILKRQGYVAIRAAGSHGLWDVWAYREHIEDDGLPLVRLIQVKKNKKPTAKERWAIQDAIVPYCCSKEIWFFAKASREPQIEFVRRDL
jgi:hypothetical protein